MTHQTIAPTKSNLMKVKERLTTASEGYELLEQKREILVMELMRKLGEVKHLENELDAQIRLAYPALNRMLVVCGREKATLLSQNISYNAKIKEKTSREAGLTLPSLEVSLPRAQLKYDACSSYAECDETAMEFFKLVKILSELAAIRTAAWHLAREVRKTQRRVNALEKMVIPQAREAKIFIESSLEEKERDSFFSSKLLKKKKAK
jgi:V/A-type H+-transporting ATPase subunit D